MKTTKRPIITLTTDFGLRDDYVGTVKGVLLSTCRDAVIVDLTHGIEPQDIVRAAMSIGHAYRFFPPGTVHLVVVDPGVGSDRSILALKASGHLFIAPDNGVLTPFLGRDSLQEAFFVDNVGLFAATISRTFHGRDIMAPVAARLADGMELSLVGPQITARDCCRIHLPEASKKGGTIVGEVIRIDHFGNLQTSITARDIASISRQKMQILIGGIAIGTLMDTYSDAGPGKTVALLDSGNHLEIAVNGGNAAAILGLRPGDTVTVSDSGPAKPGTK